MFSTDQFRVFPSAPVDRVLSRPRRLLQEGRVEESEAAYAGLLATHPEMKQTWVEYFALLRHTQRHDEALALSERAARQFGDDALPAALRGAALVELGRFRDGLTALDHAARLDPDMGLVWHEAGYAAFRLGELSRALMALDRAFALEPHGGTLHLRGQVLRQAGRYLAAEVAFEGAAQAAEFPAQRQAAEREIRRTRRYAAFPGTRPETLPPNRRWFAETGAVPLTGGEGAPVADEEILGAFAQLAEDCEWQFSVLVAADHWDGWARLGSRLGVPLVARIPPEVEVIPLVAARSPGTLPDWADLVHTPAEVGRGLSLVLEQPVEALPADVVGAVPGGRGALDLSLALEAARHPEGRLLGRVVK
jgi:tetratricopeptide (TPR) repeat protein